MTGARGIYGVAVAAAALVVISATFGGYYYLQASTASSNNSQLTAELNSANGNYTRLASNFNLLLSRYNQTISLLSQTIAVINTSLPIYKQASLELSSLWQTYQSLSPLSTKLLHNSFLFDFGNGTRRWYNNTSIDAGWNVYIETVVLTDGQVDAQWYPQFGAHLISGISGVSNTNAKYWFLWSYDKTAGWQTSQVGADAVLVASGSVYAWTYCGADNNFSPTCRP